MKACSRYMSWYPEDRVRTKSCETGIANIYYQSGDKKNAVRYLKLIATKYAKAKEGAESVELLIPIVKDNKAELAALTANLLKIPSYRKGKIGKKLQNLQRTLVDVGSALGLPFLTLTTCIPRITLPSSFMAAATQTMASAFATSTPLLQVRVGSFPTHTETDKRLTVKTVLRTPKGLRPKGNQYPSSTKMYE